MAEQNSPIYCICRTRQGRAQDWVICVNKSGCKHYLARQKTDETCGGAVFHRNCLNVSEGIVIQKWCCPYCIYENAAMTTHKGFSKSDIENLLSKQENRTLVSVKADGNCLFRALSVAKFNTEVFHQEIRRVIFGFLYGVLFSSINKFCPLYWKSFKKITNREDCLINRIVMVFLPDLIHLSPSDPSFNARQIERYLQRMMNAAEVNDEPAVKFSKYGGSMELLIYSYLEKKVIWSFQRASNSAEIFHWQLATTYGPVLHSDAVKDPNYLTLHYDYDVKNPVGSHFNCIVNGMKNPPPNPNIMYYRNIALPKLENRNEVIVL